MRGVVFVLTVVVLEAMGVMGSAMLRGSSNGMELHLFEGTKYAGNSSCLDTSSAGLFYRAAPAGSANADKFVVFFQGGGACWLKEDCEARAKTALGSSKYWPSTFVDANNVLSTESFNPFSDWNHVYVPYCSGDTHLGGNLAVNSWNLRFSGGYNAESVIAWLDGETSIGSASQILVSGSSAGGIAALHHADRFYDHYSHATVKSSPQGGFFFPEVSEYPAWKQHTFYPPYQDAIMELWGAKGFLNQRCVAEHENSPGVCFAAYKAYSFIHCPLFLAQNLFDSNQIVTQLHAPDSAEADDFVKYFGDAMVRNISQVFGGKNGLYGASCFEHTGNLAMKQSTPIHDAKTNKSLEYRDMLKDWYFEEGNLPVAVLDSCYTPHSLPCNNGCKGFP